MKAFLLVSVFLIFSIQLYSQKNFHNKGDIFDDSIVHRIDIVIDAIEFSTILEHADSNIIKTAQAVFTSGSKVDTISNIGFRIKGHASRWNDKKSYKISIDEYKNGKQFQGFEKISVNAYWNDPTHLRAHMATELFHYMRIPVARTSFCDLYINNEYQGLYNLVEHVDEEFLKVRFGTKKGNLYKCISPADLVYLGDDEEEYSKLGGGGEHVYELKRDKLKNGYKGLIELTDILNNTPIDQLEYELEKRFNIESYLKTMAIDILIGNWDSQLFSANNFYLFDNPLSGKFEFIPYDFDNTFGMDWMYVDWGKQNIYNWIHHPFLELTEEQLLAMPKQQREGIQGYIDDFLKIMKRPIYTRILEVENYRKRFETYLINVINNYYNTNEFKAEIDKHFAMITPSLKRDINDNFTWEEIQKSMYEPLETTTDFGDHQQQHLPYGLKQFVDVYSPVVLSQIEYAKK